MRSCRSHGRVQVAALVLTAVTLLAGSQPADANRLAVLEFKGSAVDQEVLLYLSRTVRGEARKHVPAGWEVVTRDSILVLIDATKGECAREGECEVQTLRNIGADWGVTGEAVRTGNLLRLSLSFYDAGKGSLVATSEAAGSDANGLVEDAKRASAQLFSAVPQPRKEAPGELAFEMHTLPPIPEVHLPAALDARVSGAGSLPTEGRIAELEAYNAAVRFDAGAALPAEKAKRWRSLAAAHPRLRDTAEERAAAWEGFVAAQQAAAEARRRRHEAMKRDWKKLSRLLPLEVVPTADRAAWARAFLRTYSPAPDRRELALTDLGLEIPTEPPAPRTLDVWRQEPCWKWVNLEKTHKMWPAFTLLMMSVGVPAGVFGGGYLGGLAADSRNDGYGPGAAVGLLVVPTVTYLVSSSLYNTGGRSCRVPDEGASDENRQRLDEWAARKQRHSQRVAEARQQLAEANRALETCREFIAQHTVPPGPPGPRPPPARPSPAERR